MDVKEGRLSSRQSSHFRHNIESSGLVCTLHPAVQGSNSEHKTYTSIMLNNASIGCH